MRKKNAIYFVIVSLLFCVFLTPSVVNAATQCEYVWNNTIIAPQKDSDGNAVSTEHKFVLSTGDDEKRLTNATSPFEHTSAAKFANKNGIALSSDGSCPQISIYVQNVAGGFKIYASNSNCKKGFMTIDGNCSENLSGKKLSSTTSDSNVTGAGIQFKLTSSSASECQYVRKSIDSTTSTTRTAKTITVKSKNNNKVTGSCTQDYGLCSLVIDVQNKFYDDNTFKCPQYVYTKADTTGKEGINSKVTIYDIGKDEDDNRSTTDENGNAVADPDDKKTFTNNASLEGLNKKYSTCNQIIDMTEGHFGWLLQKLLNYIKIAGPILVVLLSALDFIKAVASSEENVFKKAQSRLVIRLVAALALFLVPTLVQLLLGLINGINDATCGLK